MRLSAAYVLLPLLAAASNANAQAISCDWNERTGSCTVQKAWEAENSIRFSSSAPCSGIDYEVLGDGRYTTTGTARVISQPYERLPRYRGVNLEIKITGCTTFKINDETQARPSQQPSPRAKVAPPEEQNVRGGPAKAVIYCGSPEAASDPALAQYCSDPTFFEKSKGAVKTKKPSPKDEPFYNAARVQASKDRDARQKLERDAEQRDTRALEEQTLKQREAEAKKQQQEQSLFEQERQRQQSWNTIWNAVGVGVSAGVSTYNAVPKNPQPIPPQPSYKQRKVQRSSVAAPTPSTTTNTTTTHTNCPGNAAADENCNALH
jgi:type IV secretory pathway VirB10-like protein